MRLSIVYRRRHRRTARPSVSSLRVTATRPVRRRDSSETSDRLELAPPETPERRDDPQQSRRGHGLPARERVAEQIDDLHHLVASHGGHAHQPIGDVLGVLVRLREPSRVPRRVRASRRRHDATPRDDDAARRAGRPDRRVPELILRAHARRADSLERALRAPAPPRPRGRRRAKSVGRAAAADLGADGSAEGMTGSVGVPLVARRVRGWMVAGRRLRGSASTASAKVAPARPSTAATTRRRLRRRGARASVDGSGDPPPPPPPSPPRRLRACGGPPRRR